MKNVKINQVTLGGNISSIDIRNGQNGRFGNVGLAIDDGYFKKGTNNQQGSWVDRTYFINLKVNENNLKTLYTQLNKGDQLVVAGKLIVEDDKSDTSKKYYKVDVKNFISHTPKNLIEMGKANGLIPDNQAQTSKSGFQQNQPQHGGYQQQPANGGFQQNQAQQGAFQQNQPQHGGYQQQPANGGFQTQNY
ncbi:single-stranded DNA-binding protein [Thalassotalea piscium]|uniref:Single-strand DNA-binding protein n=1 Tax=Thalassotalea piscium TaxID=1230533 RepID=A0A7X0NGX6_9GAMM|nr:single-stranded DNA-binding protein [Thalassotalea piscium]MBB6543111.1 single-strand DNA-binding protein [Thalassotalea piscium]